MIDNLIFYGSGIGLGFLASITFSDDGKRKIALVISAILGPVLWSLILAAGKETLDLIELYDVRRMNYTFPQNRVIFWIIPLIISYLIFGMLWIEKNRLSNRRKK